MILSDRDIRLFINLGHIVVEPLPPHRALQPASLEVHIGQETWLAPNEFLLASTLETVTLGANVAANLTGKSSLGRLGLAVHITAGYIDPGFSGQIVLELKNLGNTELHLDKGAPIAQLVFHELRTAVARPYGHPDLGSHYQHQTGITRSYLEVSHELAQVDNEVQQHGVVCGGGD